MPDCGSSPLPGSSFLPVQAVKIAADIIATYTYFNCIISIYKNWGIIFRLVSANIRILAVSAQIIFRNDIGPLGNGIEQIPIGVRVILAAHAAIVAVRAQYGVSISPV